MATLLQRLGLVLDIDESKSHTPAEIKALRLQAFNKLKSAFTSGSQRDKSYTQPTTSYVDLMTVDFGVDPRELEPDYTPS